MRGLSLIHIFLVQFIEIFLKKYVVALYNSLVVYLPLITTNCCVLAVTILVVDDYGADVEALGFGAAYIEALVCAIGAGVGFMLAKMCIRDRHGKAGSRAERHRTGGQLPAGPGQLLYLSLIHI